MSFMHPADTGAWGIATDFPLELQFWGYIGEHEGFRLDSEQPVTSLNEIMWRRWWELFITNSYGRLLVGIERTMPGLSYDEQSRHAAVRWRLIFDPPVFESLSGIPALQELAHRYWPSFNESWGIVGGEKEALNGMLRSQWQRIRSEKLVRECVQAAGKPISRPFRLYVDFVRWPPGYFRHVSDDYVIFGKGYLEAERAELFRQIVRSYICRLV